MRSATSQEGQLTGSILFFTWFTCKLSVGYKSPVVAGLELDSGEERKNGSLVKRQRWVKRFSVPNFSSACGWEVKEGKK